MDDIFDNLPELYLPAFDVQIRFHAQRKEIFDVFRRRYVVLSPEEWVRQHMLHYMNRHLGYPASLLGVEISLRLNGLVKRADIVVYGKDASPWMIVECKAPDIGLSQQVFDQAARYNLTMRVPYLAITNGIKLMAAEVSADLKQINLLRMMPNYNL